jgi:hypothetical protein
MIWLQRILIIFLAFLFILLDVSFFSTFQVLGVSILSSYIVAINFALMKRFESTLIFCIASTIFLAVFSSLPVILIWIIYLLLPMVTFFIRAKYFAVPGIIISVLFFIGASTVMGSILLINSRGLNVSGLTKLFYLVLENAIFGILIYMIFRKMQKKVIYKEIKF